MGRKMASAALPPSDLYERDYYTWIQEQVRALRERRIEDLDWPNLAEEIEDLEKNERRLLRHQISLLLGYLLKRTYAPSKMLRARGREWEISIRQARHHIESLLKESPGLLSRIDEIFGQAYEKAVITLCSSQNCRIPRFLKRHRGRSNKSSTIVSCPIARANFLVAEYRSEQQHLTRGAQHALSGTSQASRSGRSL